MRFSCAIPPLRFASSRTGSCCEQCRRVATRLQSEKGKVAMARRERGKAAERSHRRPAVSPANSASSLTNPAISTCMCVYAPPTWALLSLSIEHGLAPPLTSATHHAPCVFYAVYQHGRDAPLTFSFLDRKRGKIASRLRFLNYPISINFR